VEIGNNLVDGARDLASIGENQTCKGDPHPNYF
jgi:hypothetical protein